VLSVETASSCFRANDNGSRDVVSPSLVHCRYNLFIRQQLTGVRHPVFAEIALAISPSPKRYFRRISITLLPLRFGRSPLRAQQIVIELADGLDRVLELHVI
jgi:hypothetical protein